MTPAIPFARGELSVTIGVCKLLMGGTWRFVRLFLFASWAFLCLCPAARALDEEARESPANQSSTKVNERVTDPVSLTWSLKLKNTVTWKEIGSGDHAQYTLQFQPTMPVWLTTDWKLIVRPEFTLVDDVPYSSHGQVNRTTGVGDTILDHEYRPPHGGNAPCRPRGSHRRWPDSRQPVRRSPEKAEAHAQEGRPCGCHEEEGHDATAA